MEPWSLFAPTTPRLVRPVAIDPAGRTGPTKGQAAGPRWRGTSTGLYVEANVDRSVVEQRILEESCRLPPGGAVTGWAALRLHGVGYLDGLAPDGRTLLPVPLVVAPDSNFKEVPGVTRHRERLSSSDVIEVHGIPVTIPNRAAFDAARRARDVRSAVTILDLALACSVITRGGLATYFESKPGWHGRRQVIQALDLADPRCMSPRETALRLIWVLDGKLPRPKSNWPVSDASGSFVARPDLLSEQLAVVGEFDGAQHRSRERQRADLLRDDRFRSMGLEPFRVVGADLYDVPLVLTRISAAIARAQSSTVPRTWRVKVNPAPVGTQRRRTGA